MDSRKLPAAKVSFMLTGTAEDARAQELKTHEENKEYLEAIEDLGKVPMESTKRVTAHLKVCMERVDKLKSEFNELRMYCDYNNLDFEKVLMLNDLNNDVRGYHEK